MNQPLQPLSGAPWRLPLGSGRIVDLSYALTEGLPPWPGDARSFEAHTESTIAADGYFTRSFWMREHFGTHLDAPAHFAPNGAAVDSIPPECLVGPAVLLDVRDAAAHDHDYELSLGSVLGWEAAHGRIPPGAIVLLRTGWASFWPDPVRYANSDAAGVMHFPGFGVAAARLLVERQVNGIGSDTMSTDPGRSADFPVHRLVLGAGLYQLENLADMNSVPEAGAALLVAPLKLQGGSGGPCRVFALLP